MFNNFVETTAKGEQQQERHGDQGVQNLQGERLLGKGGGFP